MALHYTTIHVDRHALLMKKTRKAHTMIWCFLLKLLGKNTNIFSHFTFILPGATYSTHHHHHCSSDHKHSSMLPHPKPNPSTYHHHLPSHHHHHFHFPKNSTNSWQQQQLMSCILCIWWWWWCDVSIGFCTGLFSSNFATENKAMGRLLQEISLVCLKQRYDTFHHNSIHILISTISNSEWAFDSAFITIYASTLSTTPHAHCGTNTTQFGFYIFSCFHPRKYFALTGSARPGLVESWQFYEGYRSCSSLAEHELWCLCRRCEIMQSLLKKQTTTWWIWKWIFYRLTSLLLGYLGR